MKNDAQILALIPEAPQTISARSVASALGVHTRTIQRDLLRLAKTLPLVHEGTRGTGYAWARKAGEPVACPCCGRAL